MVNVRVTGLSRDKFPVGNIHVYIKETRVKIYQGIINMGNAFTMVCVPHQKNIVAFFVHCSWAIAPTTQPATQK